MKSRLVFLEMTAQKQLKLQKWQKPLKLFSQTFEDITKFVFRRSGRMAPKRALFTRRLEGVQRVFRPVEQ